MKTGPMEQACRERLTKALNALAVDAAILVRPDRVDERSFHTRVDKLAFLYLRNAVAEHRAAEKALSECLRVKALAREAVSK